MALCERFIVKGLVQGVGFRYFTAHQANVLGLLGYAKNLIGGEVEVVAIGDEKQLDAIFEWLHTGSPAARVTHVERYPHQAEKVYKGFNIAY